MVRTEQEIRVVLNLLEQHYTGDEDSDDPIEAIRETLLFVLGDRSAYSVTDFFTE